MWMNEDEIEQAARRYRDHPVLGPATRTLAALVEWTNANSDGWPYWRKPAQAAARLMELIEQGQRHDREAGRHPRTPDVTMAAYRAALRPVKAFRTRQEKLAGPGLRPLFEIFDREGGEVFAAELDVTAARKLEDDAKIRLAAAQELVHRAEVARSRATWRRDARELAELVKAGTVHDPDSVKLAALSQPGTRLYVLPRREAGLGDAATATGLAHGWAGRSAQYVTDSGDEGSLFAPMAMSLADARDRWWVLDSDRTVIVTGGHVDKNRMDALAYSQTIQDGKLRVAVQGAEFLPAS